MTSWASYSLSKFNLIKPILFNVDIAIQKVNAMKKMFLKMHMNTKTNLFDLPESNQSRQISTCDFFHLFVKCLNQLWLSDENWGVLTYPSISIHQFLASFEIGNLGNFAFSPP